MLTEEILKLSNKYLNEMVEIRHRIHMNPELSYCEFQTAQLISDVLKSLGIAVKTGMAKTGVTGLIKGNRPGKTVLLRADMDALPIQEEADVPYKSIINNRMHACGHDGHVAGLLGAAMVLNDLRDSFGGNVKLVFQPAEEGEGGASNMIQEGVLEDPLVDAAFACHLWGPLREGKVQLCPGPMGGHRLIHLPDPWEGWPRRLSASDGGPDHVGCPGHCLHSNDCQQANQSIRTSRFDHFFNP